MKRALTRGAAAVVTVLALAGGGVAVSATPALAHNPTNCYHGNWRDGGWLMVYIDHVNTGGGHYNIYDHYLNGDFQHTRLVLCG